MSSQSFIIWQEKYSVADRVLDGQHKRLFEIINSFYEKVQQEAPGEELRGTIDELKRYGRVHFQREEALMEESGFPGLEGHRAAHRHYLDKVQRFAAEVATPDFDGHYEVFAFLKEWLLHHVLTMDKEYVPHISARMEG